MSDTADSTHIERLCRLAQSGDAHAEQELFERLTDSFRIFTQLKITDSAEAEEVVQDALTVVAQKYKDTAFHSSFAGWAYGVFQNTASSHIRRKASRSSLLPKAEVLPEDVVHPQVSDEVLRAILECFEQVARKNRKFARVLNLRYQGFTSQEICARLGFTKEYFYVVLARARSMLEACLGINRD